MFAPPGHFPAQCLHCPHVRGSSVIPLGPTVRPGTLQGIGSVSPRREPDTHVVSSPQHPPPSAAAGSDSGRRIALDLSRARRRAALCSRHGPCPDRV
ncbi:hypothetical protein NDU88_008480 [Pleurodeles waltl]|uniref:Uncharacterized protein n=1 Tax=Pleurodeles waltl TaxID=8319 RepID=A0AAV7QUR7_PLEWA|nr:hypothetical protein NDU88_008480 [Pleurodeles waltl]